SSSKQDDLSMSLPSPKVKVSQVPLNATISVAQALRTVRRRTTVNQVLLVAPPRQAAFSKVKNCPAVWAMSKLPPRTSLCTASMQRTTCCSLKVQYLVPVAALCWFAMQGREPNDMAVKKVSVDLPAELVDVEANVALMHQVVNAQLAAARQGTHATKTRAEVSGGGRKPFRQKGTGSARQGSIREPQMTGGGIAHGPQSRDYSQRTPKKMKAAALRSALSDRARNGRVHVVEALVEQEAPSTQAAKTALAEIQNERRNFLVVIDRSDDVAALSTRNLQHVHTLYADQLNTYDVLKADDVVFTKPAYDAFVSAASAK